MKKIILMSALSLSLMNASADPITPQRAQQIALEYLVSGHTMAISHKAKARKATTKNSPYYIISRGENQGFVIVAGDDCLPEVLGYTDQGDFDATNLPPALQDMLDSWQMAVETAQADGSNVALAVARKSQRKAPAERFDIPPFVTSHWHQSSPYNDNCPTLTANGSRALTGCVATAASQILYYWRKDLPSTLQASTPTYGYGDAPVKRSVPKGTPLKWDIMLDQYGSESKEYKEAVAEFVFATGAATWLTYGASTSGNIEKIPYTFSTYFGMNGGEVRYRNDYSQESWTQLIYNELLQKRPVMYTGVHPSNGGHAVFIHGYQASTDKFYFNFGWGAGNGYDGYYTTTQTNGMNGHNEYQSALIGAYPKSWNIHATITSPENVIANVDNVFYLNIENNSTIDYSGFYLFASTTNTKPSSLSTAKSLDKETIIPTGKKGLVPLTLKPTSIKTWYITITDANLNVLAKEAVDVKDVKAKVSALSLDAIGSSESQQVGEHTFKKIYSTKANLQLSLFNASEFNFGGTAKVDVYVSDDEGTTFSYFKSFIKSNVAVDAKSSAMVEMTATGLIPGKHYYAVVNENWLSGIVKDTIDISQITPTYFACCGESDFEATLSGNVLSFTGHWDPSQYSTLVNRNIYKGASMYDLTNVKGIDAVPNVTYPNPNALVYTSECVDGTNVIGDGTAKKLYLTAGYDFLPKADFNAFEACFNINQSPNEWKLITVPFDCTVPNGIIAREITSHTPSGLSTNNINNVTKLAAGNTYLIMTSSTHKQQLYYEEALKTIFVGASPKENEDKALVGTFVATSTPEGAKIVKDKEAGKAFFMNVSEATTVGAFRGYFYDPTMATATSDFRAYANILIDPSYIVLGRTIQMLYDTFDSHNGLVTDKANGMMLDSIAKAESIFSQQSITSTAAMKKYYTTLQEFAEQYQTMLSNTANGIDMTSLITNPSFELGKTTGWTLEKMQGYATVGNVYDATKANAYRGVGLDGKYIFQSLIAAADSSSVGISQEVKGLKPGYYRLTSMLGTSEGHKVTMFAGDASTTVSAHPFGRLYLTEAVIDDILVTAEDGSDTGSLNIGIKGGKWYKADNFTLTLIAPYIDPTDISDVTINTQQVSGIYTLQGMKLSHITSPGIYIIDGKKVLKK